MVDHAQVAAIQKTIASWHDEMVEALKKIISVPALSPENNGEGELKKAELIRDIISDWGFDELKRYDAVDDRVPDKIRPNIVAKIFGATPSGPTIWIVTHMDIVPVGNQDLWLTDPFDAKVIDGKIYGRGTEDNGQSLVASLFAARAILELDITPHYNIGLAIVSDEETGSKFGIQYLLEQDIFKPSDLIVVPDSGNETGTMLEVSEKSILWIKVTTIGKQCHASLPALGLNAFRIGLQFANLADKKLHSSYSETNPLFEPPESTFEMTKKEANVDNINTIPGFDVFYFDCRILPKYNPEDIWNKFHELGTQLEQQTGAKIEFDRIQEERAAPPTAPDAKVVLLLKNAIKQIYQVDAKPRGIGGGTCGAFFRRNGFPTVVWSKIDDTCHAPNEYCIIENLVNDSKVFGVLFVSDPSEG